MGGYMAGLALRAAGAESPFAPEAEWLLADRDAPTAGHGLMGWSGRLWSPHGRLVASGGGQLLCWRVPART